MLAAHAGGRFRGGGGGAGRGRSARPGRPGGGGGARSDGRALVHRQMRRACGDMADQRGRFAQVMKRREQVLRLVGAKVRMAMVPVRALPSVAWISNEKRVIEGQKP